MRRFELCFLGSCIVAAAVLSGCGDDDDGTIRSYKVSKEVPEATETASPHAPQMQSPHVRRTAIAWDLPEGWQEEINTSPGAMRYATLSVGEGENRLETSVIPLAGPAGGLEANVQRWRRQIGLEPAPEDAIRDQMTPVATKSGVEGWLVELAGKDSAGSGGPPPAMLAAIIPYQGQTWFFKATGPKPLIEQHREGFTALCQSIRFDGGPGE